MISNIIMRDFDNKIGAWCYEHEIAYTRYCDDMTFSGDFDPKLVIHLVKSELKKLGLFLNDQKTVVVRKGQKHSVTGIVVNEKLSAPSKYKKKIRQEQLIEKVKSKPFLTDEELAKEHKQWTEYIHQNIPDPFPGMERIIRRQKEEGGRIFVVSHSSSDTILRDYTVHFGIQPDAIYGWDRPAHERKPNPFPLQDIMEKYGYQPEEILVVDDMQLACQMADPLGVKVCFAGWDDMGVPQQRRDMEERCAFAFDSVEEFEKFLFD